MWTSIAMPNSDNNAYAFNATVPVAEFKGRAGGKLYGWSPGPINHDDTTPADWGADYTLTRIFRTTNPLHFFNPSIEHHPCAYQVLIEDSANVHFHAIKFESVGIGTATNGAAADVVSVYGGASPGR